MRCLLNSLAAGYQIRQELPQTSGFRSRTQAPLHEDKDARDALQNARWPLMCCIFFPDCHEPVAPLIPEGRPHREVAKSIIPVGNLGDPNCIIAPDYALPHVRTSGVPCAVLSDVDRLLYRGG
jgi:hypothetical protein